NVLKTCVVGVVTGWFTATGTRHDHHNTLFAIRPAPRPAPRPGPRPLPRLGGGGEAAGSAAADGCRPWAGPPRGAHGGPADADAVAMPPLQRRRARGPLAGVQGWHATPACRVRPLRPVPWVPAADRGQRRAGEGMSHRRRRGCDAKTPEEVIAMA